MGRKEIIIQGARVIIEENPRHLARTAADVFADWVRVCLAERTTIAVAVSGGSTPRGMHRLLAEEPYRSGILWSDIHFFWVDERCVPETAPESNYGTARSDLFDHVPVPKDHVHPMPYALPPEEGARAYENGIRDFFRLSRGSFPEFDLILLGMGSDGHTASLFPGHDSLHERRRLVCAVKGGDPHVSRLTMTFPVLNSARRVVFLVAGEEKAEIVRTIFTEDASSGLLPARMVRAARGTPLWLLDRDAASHLDM